MKYIGFLFGIIVIISCNNSSNGPAFTDKWWRSAADTGFYVKFNSDGTYTKEFYLTPFIPSSFNPGLNMKMIVSGEWEIEGSNLIIQTSIPVNNGDTDVQPVILTTDGYPGSYYYGYLWNDTSYITHTLLGRWSAGESVDSIPARFTTIADSIQIINPSVVWVISKIREDSLELFINSRLEKFVYVNDKE